MIRKLGPVKKLRVCYEAGPTGYVLYWQLTQMRVHCDVVAPTLVPAKPGDRVKTDRRDADKLAGLYRGGHLNPGWGPGKDHQGLGDLGGGGGAAKSDPLPARPRPPKFLPRPGGR